MRFNACLILLVITCACTPAAETGKFLADNLKDSMYETAYAIDDWANTPPKGKGELKPMAHRYCYKVQTDILCYRQPMPGMETQLVGYQGQDAPTPPAATMRLMPKSALNESVKPQNRVLTAKPVIEKLPEAAPAINTHSEEGEVNIDSSNETLPDPTSSPQL